MSLEILELYQNQRKEEIENGPFSEEFTIIGGGIFRGIFDRSHIENNKDDGNINQKKLYPRIMANERPVGLIEQTTIISRENGEEYTFFFEGIDDEGIFLLWLF